ncbi:MAG: polysaccharide deacetylase family protein [bacterium]
MAIERLGPAVSDRIQWRARRDRPNIALTFDDGPQPVYTPQLLQVLEKHKVAATFFLIGQHIEAHSELAQQIVGAGHEVANHTFTHPLMWRLSDQEMVEEINRTDQLLRRLNGAGPRFLRPPMGLFSRRVLDIVEQTGYKAVVGDVYPRDPHLPGRERIVSRVLKRVRNGSIIILHDGGNSHDIDRSQTVWAVDQLIPQLRARGFEFETLSKLLTDSVSM